MNLKKLLVYSPNKHTFEVNLANGIVDSNAIVFIEDPKEIWAQGNYYPCPYSKVDLDEILNNINVRNTSDEEALDNFILAIKGNVTEEYNSLEKIESKIQLEVTNINTLSDKLDSIEIVKVAASNNTIASSYELHDKNGNKKGVTIDIPKDLSIKDIKISTIDATLNEDGEIVDGTGIPALCFSCILSDGTYKIVALDYSQLIEESKFNNGLEVINHQVQVKIDSTSESYLTVGSNGIKLSGVKTTIDRVDSIWNGNPDLVTLTLSGSWTIYKLDNTVVTPTPSFPVEDGYKAKYTGTWKWQSDNDKKNPITTAGTWGTSLPASGVDSASFTSPDYVTTNTTYSQSIFAPKLGLMVSGTNVQPASGNDTKSASTTASFARRIYYGASSSNDIGTLSGTVLATSRARTLTGITTDNSLYFYYAYPKSLGALTSIIQDGATPILGAFTRSETTIINSAGLSVTLYVYKTNNLGAFTNNSLKFE